MTIRVNLSKAMPEPSLKWEGMTADGILQLYGQQEHWIDGYGVQHKLVNMDDSYLWNVIGFIGRIGSSHLFQAALRVLFTFNRFWGPHPSDDAFDNWSREDDSWATWEARPWESPVGRAIAAELARRVSYQDVFPTCLVYSKEEIYAFQSGEEIET